MCTPHFYYAELYGKAQRNTDVIGGQVKKLDFLFEQKKKSKESKWNVAYSRGHIMIDTFEWAKFIIFTKQMSTF